MVPDNGADGAVHVRIPSGLAGQVVIDGSYTIETLTIEPGATLVIGDGNTLTLRGDVTNDGKIRFDGMAMLTVDGREAQPVSLLGSGTVEMTDPRQAINGSSGQLLTIAEAQTIMGVGQIGANTIDLVNEGTILANVAGELLVIDPETRFHNVGEVHVRPQAMLTAEPGIYSAEATGSYVVGDHGELFFRDITFTGGTLKADDQDHDFTNNSPKFTNDSTFAGLVNEGYIAVYDPSVLQLTGDLTNNGLIDLHATNNFEEGPQIQVDQEVTILGKGRLEAPSGWRGNIAGSLVGDGVLVNSPEHTLVVGGVGYKPYPDDPKALNIVNLGSLHWRGGTATNVWQTSGSYSGSVGAAEGGCSFVNVEGGMLNFTGGIYCDIRLNAEATFSVWGDEIDVAKIVTSVDWTTKTSELKLNGTRMEFQIESESSYDRLEMFGNLAVSNGILSLTLTGPARGFRSGAEIEIVRCGGFYDPWRETTFGGTVGLDLANVTSGNRIITADGKASFVVTLANNGLASFRSEPFELDTVGGITLSDPLFGPEFESPSYAFVIGKGAVEGTAIGALEAVDPEGDDFTYGLEPGSPFAIDPILGVITVADASAVANSTRFEVVATAVATDGTLRGEASVSIAVGDPPSTTDLKVANLLNQQGSAFEGIHDLAIVGARADPDRDGFENLLELWLMTDPAQPSSRPAYSVESHLIRLRDHVWLDAGVRLAVSPIIDDQFDIGGIFSADLVEARPANRVAGLEAGGVRNVWFGISTMQTEIRSFMWFTQGGEDTDR